MSRLRKSQFRTKNLLPGKSRGIKARKNQGRLLPRVIGAPDGFWRNHRDMERNPRPLDGYKPFRPKPIKRRERRGQAKPR